MIEFGYHKEVRFQSTKRVDPRDIVLELDGVMDERSPCRFLGKRVEINSALPSLICSDMFMSGNMYHIVCDHLARAWYYMQQYDENINYLFPKQMWPWSQWAVNKVLKDRKAVRVFESDVVYTIKNCYVPSNLYRESQHRPYVYKQHEQYLKALRDCLTEGIEPIKMNKIYISRKLGSGRKILNEQQLEDQLIKKGYFIACLETMTPEEQIAVFMGAKTIVTPHGAALTNIVGRSEGEVYELRQVGNKVRCYQHVANKLEIHLEDKFVIDSDRCNIQKTLDWLP